ncbi:MAG: NAD(P)/FAD-dependent oxidoreductase [Halobacteriota archaeon]|nr:NAD(P)/FAD-dependent oxidoreductase [Halobacteriota archaeon]
MQEFDVVVIGAGISGLSTAALLSKAGFNVSVYESFALGGRATTMDMNGMLVDLGSHICPGGERGEIATLMRYVGGHVNIIPFEDKLIYFNGRLSRESDLISSKETEKEVDRIQTDIYSMTFEDTEVIDNVPFGDWIDERTENEEAKEYFFIHSYVMTSLPSPYEQSAGCVARRIQDWLRCGIRAGYPEGGFISFSRELSEAITRIGGHLNLNTQVKEIITEDGVAKGVKIRVNGEEKEVRSKIVVSSLPVWDNFKLIPEEEFPTWFVKRVRYLEDDSFFAGIGIIARLKKPLYEGRMYVSALKTPINKVTLQIWHPSNFTRSIVPEGKHLLTGGMILGRHDCMDRKEMKKISKTYVDEICTIFPDYDWEDHCEWKTVAISPKSLIDGVHRRPYQIGKQRPDNKSPIKNLFLCGDTVKSIGCGIDTPIRSAYFCVNSILREVRGS